jgi:hypothetical protein
MQVVPVPADESVLRGVREPQGRVPGGSGAFLRHTALGLDMIAFASLHLSMYDPRSSWAFRRW